MDPRNAAGHLWVDALIDPAETRQAISRALAAAACNPEVNPFRTGMLQT
jgi:acetyl-CoA carboxylase carboxyltransferase component